MQTRKDVIDSFIAKAGEWLEMSKDPAGMLAGILANEIIRISEENEYLKGKIEWIIRSSMSSKDPTNGTSCEKQKSRLQTQV